MSEDKLKGLMIYPMDLCDPNHGGIRQKSIGQFKGMEENGIDCDQIHLCGSMIIANGELSLPKQIKPFNTATLRMLFFRRIIDLVGNKCYDICLIRYRVWMPQMDRFLHLIKKNNPKCKVAIEVPTFPYSMEWEGPLARVVLRLDKMVQRKANPYIDLIIHPGGGESIWGKPTMHIDNAVLIQKTLLKPYDIKDEIRLIAIGKWRKWHGLDRLIVAMRVDRETVQNHRISLTIVGTGSETRRLKQLSQNLELTEHISFMGAIAEDHLRFMLKKQWIGVGTLGLHRKGKMLNSSLKHRTYCAYGVPFILSGNDLSFPADLPFVNYFPDNDEPISIEEVVNFHSKLHKMRDVRREMQEYATKKLNWSQRMRSVLEGLGVAGPGNASSCAESSGALQ